MLATAGARDVIGFGGGLLGETCAAIVWLRFEMTSIFFLRAVSRVRMLATTLSSVSVKRCQHNVRD